MCSVVLFCAGLKACKKLIVYAKFGFKYSNWRWGCASPVLRDELSKGWDKGLDGGSQGQDGTGLSPHDPGGRSSLAPRWAQGPVAPRALPGPGWDLPGLWVKLWDVPRRGIGAVGFWSIPCLKGTLPCARAVVLSRRGRAMAPHGAAPSPRGTPHHGLAGAAGGLRSPSGWDWGLRAEAVRGDGGTDGVQVCVRGAGGGRAAHPIPVSHPWPHPRSQEAGGARGGSAPEQFLP